MSTSTLTSKGQITLPKTIRERLHLRAGDKVEFIVLDDGRVELIPVTAPVTRLKGMVPPPKKPVSLEAMETAIRRRAGRT
jgi:AbrB family looped-hinge helix DNA binding protein